MNKISPPPTPPPPPLENSLAPLLESDLHKDLLFLQQAFALKNFNT